MVYLSALWMPEEIYMKKLALHALWAKWDVEEGVRVGLVSDASDLASQWLKNEIIV